MEEENPVEQERNRLYEAIVEYDREMQSASIMPLKMLL